MCFLWGGIHTHADTLSRRLIPYICCMCVLCSLATVWCWCVSSLRLFELLESKPSVAVKVLLDGLRQAKWGYTQTVAATWARKLLMNCFQLLVSVKLWGFGLVVKGHNWHRTATSDPGTFCCTSYLSLSPHISCLISTEHSQCHRLVIQGSHGSLKSLKVCEFKKRSRHLKSLNWFIFSLCLMLANSLCFNVWMCVSCSFSQILKLSGLLYKHLTHLFRLKSS